jgi:hypothetical protein
MYQNLFAIGWARHDIVQIAMVQVPKANPTLSSHISMLSTKNIVYGSIAVHVELNQLLARVQIGWVYFPNRIRQT